MSNYLKLDSFKKLPISESDYWINPSLGLMYKGSKEDLQVCLDKIDLSNQIVMQDEKKRDCEIILLITNKCNLSCVYCYSQKENLKYKDMDFNTAKIAIDFKLNEYTGKTFSVFFHGDGEPTLNFVLIKKVTQYVIEECSKRMINYSFRIISNGVFSSEICNFLIDNKFKVIISIDGYDAIQNSNRPINTGEESFPYVMSSVEKLVDNYISVRARTTVMSSTIKDLVNLVSFFKSSGFSGVTLEPVKQTGKAFRNNVAAVSSKEFANEFIKCIDYGVQNNIQVSCFHELRFPSILDRVQHRNVSFCGSNGDYMLVAADGTIRSCFEFINSPFIYGQIGSELKIDNESLNYLQGRVVDKLEGCSNCFAKYSCGGGCSYLSILKNGEYLNSNKDFCASNRKIIAHALKNVYEQKRCMGDSCYSDSQVMRIFK